MSTNHKQNHTLLVVTILLLTAIFTSACSYDSGLRGDISQVVDITIDKDTLNHSEPHFTIHGHDFWHGMLEDVSRVELHDGYLRFKGMHRQPDGSLVDGTIDLSLVAENGDLVARIIAVNIEGIELSDLIVVETNHDLQEHLSNLDFDSGVFDSNHVTHLHLSNLDFESGASVHFQEVKITENALYMKLLVNIRF